MKALVCIEPGTLSLEDRPRPSVAPGQVLVRPRRVGICGTDYHIFEGKHPFLQYPRVMGHELAVEAVETPEGSGVQPGEIFAVNPYLACGHCIACRKGKPNCCTKVSVLGVHQDGGMAGLLPVPVANLVRAPGLSLDQCAMVEFLSIGAHAVRRGAVTREDRVLVVGAGPIGLGVILFAHLAGATVAVLDQDRDRGLAAKSIADIAAFTADEGGLAGLSDFTDGEGFDVVFDATGSPRAMEKGFDHVAHGGRYVLVSVVKDAISFTDPDFHRKEMTLLGSRNATSADFERVIAAISDGSAPVDRLITHRTDLDGAVHDISRWAKDKSGLIKAIVEID
ncbi:MAG: zinc-binding alcohol dehydrogenase family protein [Mesorhizobium sp.]|nr:zinc-binding alcohol dehydrogenase family protein [Mesorhizobium sp.]MCO5162681.1 zinc-binding alcohol dehydrogenase family protein [Mesorhizobium sp.]